MSLLNVSFICCYIYNHREYRELEGRKKAQLDEKAERIDGWKKGASKTPADASDFPYPG